MNGSYATAVGDGREGISMRALAIAAAALVGLAGAFGAGFLVGRGAQQDVASADPDVRTRRPSASSMASPGAASAHLAPASTDGLAAIDGPVPGESPAVTAIRAGIVRVDDHHYAVQRFVIDKILEDQAELMKTTRIVPTLDAGKTVGVTLFGIRPGTLMAILGLRDGDVLQTINGFDMTSPDKALEAYAKLRTATRIAVGLQRAGTPFAIDYDILEPPVPPTARTPKK